MATQFIGPVVSNNGFQVGTEAAPVNVLDASANLSLPVTATFNRGAPGGAGTLQTILKQIDAIVDAVATDILTITVPNVSGGAGGRLLVSSTISEPAHIGDSTRTVEYLWSVTRLAGAVAVITISIITGGSVIATKAGGSTFTSTVAASAVTGGATAVNTFTFQVTNTGTPASATRATLYAECLNNRTGGVTIS